MLHGHPAPGKNLHQIPLRAGSEEAQAKDERDLNSTRQEPLRKTVASIEARPERQIRRSILAAAYRLPLTTSSPRKRQGFVLVVASHVALDTPLKSRIVNSGRRHTDKTLLERVKHQLAFVVQAELAHDRLPMGADCLRG